MKTEVDPGFSSRGSAQDYVSAHTLWARKSFVRSGSRGRLRALETLRFFNAFSCYQRLFLKHSDTKWDTIKHIHVVNQNLGGHAPVVSSSSKSTTGERKRFSAGSHCQHIISFLLGLSQYKTKENVYKKFVTHGKTSLTHKGYRVMPFNTESRTSLCSTQ